MEEDEDEKNKEDEKELQKDKDEEKDEDLKEMRRKKNLQVEKEFWDWVIATNQIPPHKQHLYQELVQQVDKKEDKDDLVQRLSSLDED